MSLMTYDIQMIYGRDDGKAYLSCCNLTESVPDAMVQRAKDISERVQTYEFMDQQLEQQKQQSYGQ